jgi:hypothetical protein
MLPEFARDILVSVVHDRQLERDRTHVQAIHRHPARAVRLRQSPAARQRLRPVKDADVVEPEEAALEYVVALDVLAVDPPCEIEQQLLEDAGEEFAVALARALLVDLVNTQRSPRVHRRIHIAKRPFVSRDLAVRMHVPLAEHQDQLLLCKFEIDQSQRDAMKRQVPRRVPWVFPLVGHRDDVGIVEMRPAAVAAVQPRIRRARHRRITL